MGGGRSGAFSLRPPFGFSMYAIQVELTALDSLRSDRARERCIEQILDALAACNLELMKSVRLPRLYSSGVRYQNDEDEPIDRWKDAAQVLRDGHGDCDDLVPWRLAELWLDGIPARSVAHLTREADGSVLFHATLVLGNGQPEDPSERLGMR